MNKICLSAIMLLACSQVFAQAINAINTDGSVSAPVCGSNDLMLHIDDDHSGYMDESNQMMEQIQNIVRSQYNSKDATDLYTIPVVFHVVYNSPDENLPDSVLHNQIEILNKCFRRQNADKINTRSEFIPYVGDMGISFEMASIDPDGNATTGITRTYSDVEHFGGILPYGPGQNQEITDWVGDSLYYNYFRLTDDALGGKSAWNTDEYLNVWIGDLRIFEPQFSNFEELVFFGLATPPAGHSSFPDSLIADVMGYEDGVLLHYINVGSNNPQSFPAPYTTYNGVTNVGKTLVHEAGHYLGLRHIWGDGDCSFDDYVDDTPNASAQSNFNCSLFANNCVDNIDGVDLPNMVENYMDYSSGSCQNSFTKGQRGIMREVLESSRVNLPTVTSMLSVKEELEGVGLVLFPNPTNGSFTIKLNNKYSEIQVSVYDVFGREVLMNTYSNVESIQEELQQPAGVYFVEIKTIDGQSSKLRLIIR